MKHKKTSVILLLMLVFTAVTHLKIVRLPLVLANGSSTVFGWGGFFYGGIDEIEEMLFDLYCDGWNATRLYGAEPWRSGLHYSNATLDYAVSRADELNITVYLNLMHNGEASEYLTGHKQEWIDFWVDYGLRYNGSDNVVIEAVNEWDAPSPSTMYSYFNDLLAALRAADITLPVLFNYGQWETGYQKPSEYQGLTDPINNYMIGIHRYGNNAGMNGVDADSYPVDLDTFASDEGLESWMQTKWETNTQYSNEWHIINRLGIQLCVTELGGSWTHSNEHVPGGYVMDGGNVAFVKKYLEYAATYGANIALHRIGSYSDYDAYYELCEEYFDEAFWPDPDYGVVEDYGLNATTIVGYDWKSRLQQNISISPCDSPNSEWDWGASAGAQYSVENSTDRMEGTHSILMNITWAENNLTSYERLWVDLTGSPMDLNIDNRERYWVGFWLKIEYPYDHGFQFRLRFYNSTDDFIDFYIKYDAVGINLVENGSGWRHVWLNLENDYWKTVYGDVTNDFAFDDVTKVSFETFALYCENQTYAVTYWIDDLRFMQYLSLRVVTQPLFIDSTDLPVYRTIPLRVVNDTYITTGLVQANFSAALNNTALTINNLSFNSTYQWWVLNVTVPSYATGVYYLYVNCTLGQYILRDRVKISIYNAVTSFTFASITDFHIASIWLKIGDQGRQNLVDVVKELNDVDGLAFVLCNGDVQLQNDNQSDIFLESLENLYAPLVIVQGNHECDSWATQDKIEESGGIPYFDMTLNTQVHYSFDYGDYHFIGLDSVYYLNGAVNLANVTEATLNWLDVDIAQVDPTLTFLWNHAPPMASGVSWVSSEDALTIMVWCRDNNITAMLSGDWHYFRSELWNNVTFIVTGSVTFSYIPVTHPQKAGYRIVMVDGDSFNSTVVYVSTWQAPAVSYSVDIPDMTFTPYDSGHGYDYYALDPYDYLFVEKQYYTFSTVCYDNNGYDEIAVSKLRFSDGYHTVTVSLNLTSEVWTLETGDGYAYLKAGSYRTYDVVYLEVNFSIYLRNSLLDIQAAFLEAYTEDVYGYSYYGWFSFEGLQYTGRFNIYNTGGWSALQTSGDAGRLPGGDVFELYAFNNSCVEASVVYNNLQHVKMLPILMIGDGFPFCYVTYFWDFYVNDAWQTGWALTLDPSTAYMGSNRYWNFTALWYNAGSLVKNESIHVYWEWEYGITWGNLTTQLWFDFWINNMNGSSVGSGRVNAYYFPMKNNANEWLQWLTGNDWGVFEELRKQSMFFARMQNSSGDTVHSQHIEMVKFGLRLNVTSEDFGYIQLSDYDVRDLTLAGPPLKGISTPVFDETKVPVMPQGGFLGALLTGLRWLGTYISENILYGGLNLWGMFVGFLDTIAGWLGFPNAFSNFILWLGSLWTWLGTSFTHLITYLTSAFVFIGSFMGKALNTTGTGLGIFANMFAVFFNIIGGTYEGTMNLWTTLNLPVWVQIFFIVVYPLYLLWLWEERGLDAVISHIRNVIDVFAFVGRLFIGVIQLFLNVIGSIIESIPIVE